MEMYIEKAKKINQILGVQRYLDTNTVWYSSLNVFPSYTNVCTNCPKGNCIPVYERRARPVQNEPKEVTFIISAQNVSKESFLSVQNESRACQISPSDFHTHTKYAQKATVVSVPVVLKESTFMSVQNEP